MRPAKKSAPEPSLSQPAEPPTSQTTSEATSQNSQTTSESSQQSTEIEIDLTKDGEFMKKHGVYSSKAKRDNNLKRDFTAFLKKDDGDTDRLIEYLKEDHQKRLRSQPSAEEPDDEDSLFCRSLARQMRALSAEKKSLLKFRIQQSIYECQYGFQAGFQAGFQSTSPATPRQFRQPQSPRPIRPVNTASVAAARELTELTGVHVDPVYAYDDPNDFSNQFNDL